MTAQRPRPHRVLLAAAAAVPVALLFPHPASAQSSGNRLQGIDVSDWQEQNAQGHIDWATVKNVGGKSFAFIRSSRGGTTGAYDEHARTGTLSQRYDDYEFVYNITNAVANGLYAGPYHFARPDIVTNWPTAGQLPNTGADDAAHFLQQARPWMRPGYLLPVLDLESGQPNDPSGTPGRSAAALSAFAIDFSNTIKATVGVAPLIYINQNYANYVQSSVATAMPNNWVARWNDQGTPGYDWRNVDWNNGNPAPSPSTANVYGKWNPNYPTIPNSQSWPGEQPWKFWQYTSVGRVPGIGNNSVAVDLDVVHGGIDYLKDYLVPALWTANSNGDWSSIANWNSNNPTYVAGNNATGPAPRLPGPDDTVTLNNALSPSGYTVTLSAGTHTIRKLYVQQPLNLTGGSLTINYTPVAESTPISAQFSQNVSLSGNAALSVHTLLVDPSRTFTLSGGTLTLNTLTLTASVTPAKLLLAGNVTLNPLNNASAVITSTSTSTPGTLDLGGSTRTLTIGNGSSSIDLTLDVSVSNGSITKSGAGTLQLNKSASFNSTVMINAGTLIATQNNQLGTGVSLASAGSLHLAGSLSYNLPLTISGAGAAGIVGSSGTPASPGGPGALHALTGSPTWSGNITLTGSGANGTDPLINQVSSAAGSTLTLSGVISSTATGALAKSGAGDLVLAGNSPNTYTGLSRLYGGRIILEKDAALGTAAAHTFMLANSATTIAFRSASSLNYATQEYLHTDGTGAPGFAQVDNLAGNNTFAGSIAIAGPSNVGSIGVTAGSLTISGGLYSRSGASSRTINKLGPGTLVLTGNSADAPASSLAVPLTNSALNVTAGTVDLRSPVASSPNVPGLSAYTVSPGATLLNTTGTLTNASLSVDGTFRQTTARLQDVSLTVTGGLAQLSPSPLAPSLLSSLTLSGSAQLDLTSNDLAIDYATTSPADTVRQYLLAGRNNGAWTGTAGILSSTAAADPQLRTAIAYADASLLDTADLDGTPVDPTTLLLKYTYYGDANLDGKVNADDFTLLDRGFANHLTGWTNGDFDYDNTITSADYLLIDRVFAQQSGPLSPSFLSMRESQFGPAYVSELIASIPEPSSAACLFAGLGPLLSRRRRTQM